MFGASRTSLFSAILCRRLHRPRPIRRDLRARTAASSAVDSLEEVVKYLLVGPDVVMTTTALLRHGLEHMTTLVEDLHDGLAARDIDSVAGIRGRMSLGALNDPTAFDRITIFSGGKRPKFKA
jgi:hypothetical protein